MLNMLGSKTLFYFSQLIIRKRCSSKIHASVSKHKNTDFFSLSAAIQWMSLSSGQKVSKYVTLGFGELSWTSIRHLTISDNDSFYYTVISCSSELNLPTFSQPVLAFTGSLVCSPLFDSCVTASYYGPCVEKAEFFCVCEWKVGVYQFGSVHTLARQYFWQPWLVCGASEDLHFTLSYVALTHDGMEHVGREMCLQFPRQQRRSYQQQGFWGTSAYEGAPSQEKRSSRTSPDERGKLWSHA